MVTYIPFVLGGLLCVWMFLTALGGERERRVRAIEAELQALREAKRAREVAISAAGEAQKAREALAAAKAKAAQEAQSQPAGKTAR